MQMNSTVRGTRPAKTDTGRTSERQQSNGHAYPDTPAANDEIVKRRDAAAKALAIIGKSRLAEDTHPYLVRKGVRLTAPTLFEIDTNALKAVTGYVPRSSGEPLQGRILVAPVHLDGVVSTLEFIDELGRKSALANGAKTGGAWIATSHELVTNHRYVVIAEGVSTSMSVQYATGAQTFAALSCTNLLKVAKWLRAQQPDAVIVIAADVGNGADHARKAAGAVDGFLAVPDFGPMRQPDETDFNDLEQRFGTDAVRAKIEAALVSHAKPPVADEVNDENDAQSIARLAKLTSIEYERTRADAAQRLGIRPTLLDRLVKVARDEASEAKARPFEIVEPHAEPVDGEAMLNDIARVIRRFVVADAETIAAVALWIVASWFVEVLHVAPILLIDAPQKSCGKTQLLTVCGRLVPRPATAAGISPSAIFRLIEKYAPTLLIDEVETVLTKDNEELRGLVNSGHTRDSAYVWRSVPVGDSWEPQRFATFGYKALAGINSHRLAETVTSRAIVATLRKKLKTEQTDKLRRAEPGLFETLRAKLARWSFDNTQAIREADPDIPEAMGDRDGDNWESLFCVADLAGGRWPDFARKAALKLSDTDGDQSMSTGSQLLSDIRDVFARRKTDKLHSIELVSALRDLEESPWDEWNRGKGLTVMNLARLLAEYKVKSRQIKIAGENQRGYLLLDFEDAFRRYADGF